MTMQMRNDWTVDHAAKTIAPQNWVHVGTALTALLDRARPTVNAESTGATAEPQRPQA